MPTTIATLQPGVKKLLGNRSDVDALSAQEIADVCIELGNDYPFEELRETGPVVQFQANVGNYAPEYFMKPTRAGLFNKVISWFFYLQPPINLLTSPNDASNPGYNLVFRDIEDLEVLNNTLTLPMFWSQLGQDTLYVAAVPNQAYYTYMRYQFLQQFTQPAATTDPILLPINWYDIIQYAAAERIALQLRMQDVADRYHRILFGDPEFERSSGGRGKPGLIFRRISQTQKNQARSTRSVRLVGRSSY